MSILFFLSQIIIVPALSPLAIGIIRKIKALMQGRVGAPVIQPYRELWKLFHKDEVISRDASWIFRFAPYLIFSITLLLGASVPVLTAIIPAVEGISWLTFLPVGDFLVVIYLFALMTFFMALAGLEAGPGFGGFGSSREMLVASLTEAGLLFSLLVASVVAQTGNVFGMVSNLQFMPLEMLFPLLIAFIAFMIALLAENKRFPVDNPSTHLELTMIHEAMILEYSGKRLALMEWASWNKLLIFIALGVNIFLPWGMALELDAAPVMLFSALLFLLKASLILFAIAFIESTIAKLRIFRVPDLLFTSLVLGIIALAVSVTF